MNKPRFSFRSMPIASVDDTGVEVLRTEAETEEVFSAKLEAFIDLDSGHEPERQWLLKGFVAAS